MKAALSLLALSIASLLLSGCAGSLQPDSQAVSQPPATPIASEPDTQPPVVYGQFSKDTLFSLLSAEIAGQRNHFDLALRNYLVEARKTRDPGVIERALRVAEYLDAQSQALEMAVLWQQRQPDNPEALRAAALYLARAGELQQSMAMMQRVLEARGETNFDFLALAATDADATTRATLLTATERLLGNNPENPQLVFAKALLMQQQERSEEALAWLQEQPQQALSTPSLLLQTRLLGSLGRSDEAIPALQRGVVQHPDDQRLRLLLARLLVSSGQHSEAAEQFAILAAANPDDSDLQLSLGLVMLEAGEPARAAEHLGQVLDSQPDNDTAAYHLGLAQQQLGLDEEALMTWLGIASGPEYLGSRLQISQMLSAAGQPERLDEIFELERHANPGLHVELFLLQLEALQQQHPEQAMAVANRALQQLPGDSRLLYSRAMLHEQLDNLSGLEADLRRILADDPQNAMAMNALGYTLADRNLRLEEALELIEQALALAPEDPAIIDSLGWVHFRLGNLELAEELLRRAYAAFPDQEVAAHLGEVLWMLGKRREAREVWDAALRNDPDSPQVRETRQRLEQR